MNLIGSYVVESTQNLKSINLLDREYLRYVKEVQDPSWLEGYHQAIHDLLRFHQSCLRGMEEKSTGSF